jgi:hypothetical protein
MIWAWLLAACGGVAIDAVQRAELEAIASEVSAAAEEKDAVRRSALAVARARIGPRPDQGACPVRVKVPAEDDVGTFSADRKTFHLGTAPISVVRESDLATSRGPRAFRLGVSVVDDVRSMLYYTYRGEDAAAVEAGLADARRLREPTWGEVDATLVIDRYLAPKVDGTVLSPGRLQGRLYVYRYSDSAIVCAADVWAENSDRLGVRKHMDEGGGFRAAASDLDRDLFKRGVEAGILGLAAAGPRVFPIDGAL